MTFVWIKIKYSCLYDTQYSVKNSNCVYGRTHPKLSVLQTGFSIYD